MKRNLALLVLALAVTGIARFWIFRLQDKDIAPEYYEHKMRLEDFWLQERSIPSGFRLAGSLPGNLENPSTLEPADLAKLARSMPGFPSADKIVSAHAAGYASTLGDQALVAACQYGPEGAPEPPTGFAREGVFLYTAWAPAPVTRERFMNALSERLNLLKKEGVKLNKLKTIGNVLLKLFMDLLVGAFAFMLALFLVKYFLIIRRVEE